MAVLQRSERGRRAAGTMNVPCLSHLRRFRRGAIAYASQQRLTQQLNRDAMLRALPAAVRVGSMDYAEVWKY